MTEDDLKAQQRWRLTYILILTASLLWCAVLLVSPLLASEKHQSAFWIRLFFSRLCHQQPDRSLWMSGISLPVCARCTGIYFGFLLGTALFPVLKKPLVSAMSWRLWFGFALALGGSEWLISKIGLFTNLWVRAGTGLVLGILTAYCTLRGLSELLHQHFTSERGQNE